MYSVIVAELHGLCNYLVGNIVICVLGNVTNVQITLVKVCCLVTSNIIHVYMQYMDVSVCPYMMYMCCVGLPCCLFDLACLFLPSFSSLRKKKERSKQGQINKQGKATQHTQGSHLSLKK